MSVALFVTCLVENLKPSVGFDTMALLEDAGYEVSVPAAQVCCGQPNYNGGDKNNAIRTARQVIDLFLPFDYVVAPSGSCAGMIKHHYPQLLEGDQTYAEKSRELSEKTYELSQFLTHVASYAPAEQTESPQSVTYHDGCAGLRELSIKAEPRQLLESQSHHITEMEETEACCGFGGTFCVKYPAVSARMAEEKVQNILNTGAETLVAGDLGCLLNLEGKLHRDGETIAVRHFAEILASPLNKPSGKV